MTRHRCGGMLKGRDVQVQIERDGLSLLYVVPGVVCDRCGEELIDRDTAIEFEKSQMPTVVLHEPQTASSQQAGLISFGQHVAGTVGLAVA